MGHVSPGEIPAQRQGPQFSGRQRRRAGTSRPALANRRQVARFGERLAAEFLARRGAVILGRNLRSGRGEVDLLIDMAGETIAVEVKTRGAGPADPAERFTPAKAAKVRQAARRLPRRASRIDLVTVSLGDDGVDIRWVPRAG